MSIKLDTAVVSPAKRLTAWQDIVCDAYVQLECRSDVGDAFWGAVELAEMGPVRCTKVSAAAQVVERTKARINRAREEFVLVSLGDAGSGVVAQDGREAFVRPGQFVLYDTTRPYTLRFGGNFSQVILQFPKDMVRRHLGNADRFTALSFDGRSTVDQMTYRFLRDMAENADKIGVESAQNLADQALALIAIASSEKQIANPIQTSHRSALLLRFKLFVNANIANPDLNLSSAAMAFGISPRYLNNLLADEGTSFQRYVLAQRLERCQAQIRDPQFAGRSISEIAFSWGFSDMSHFSRAFRLHYGRSPRDCRKGLGVADPGDFV